MPEPAYFSFILLTNAWQSLQLSRSTGYLAPAGKARVAAHHRRPLLLGHLVNAQVKRLDGLLVRGQLVAAVSHRVTRPGESTRTRS